MLLVKLQLDYAGNSCIFCEESRRSKWRDESPITGENRGYLSHSTLGFMMIDFLFYDNWHKLVLRNNENQWALTCLLYESFNLNE